MEESKAGNIITILTDQAFCLKSWYEPIQKQDLDPGLPVPTGLLHLLFFMSNGVSPFSAQEKDTRGMHATGISSSLPEQPQEGSNKTFMIRELSYWDFWISLNPIGCWKKDSLLQAFLISNNHRSGWDLSFWMLTFSCYIQSFWGTKSE